MTWTTEGTAVTGNIITAAFWNTNVRDNLDVSEAAVITTAGDITYATGSHALTRLAVGTDRSCLRVNAGATAPEWSLNGPSSSMYTTGNGLDFQSIPNNTKTTVVFSTSDFDFNSTGTLASGKLTAKATGIYLINGTISLTFTPSVTYNFYISIERYNSLNTFIGTYASEAFLVFNGSTNQTFINTSRNISSIIPMTDTDYVLIKVVQISGGSLNTAFKSATSIRSSAIFNMVLL